MIVFFVLVRFILDDSALYLSDKCESDKVDLRRGRTRAVGLFCGITVRWAHWTTGHTNIKLAILSKMLKK